MDVVVANECRFDRTPDGTVWTQAMFAHGFWSRYLDAFDRVRVVARVRDVAAVPSDWIRADGGAVSFAPVPYYLGPWQYLRRARRVRAATRRAVGPADAVILRVGSQVAATLEPLLRRTGHPYGVEVVGDPYDVFAPGAVRHPLRRFCRWWFPRQLRRQCAGACTALYVTDEALQRRYPGPADSVGVSDVELPEAAFAPGARPAGRRVGPYILVMVGTLAQLYKAPDVLIDSVAACVHDGLDLQLVLIGDGKHRPELEARKDAAGLGRRVQFAGQLPAGEAVRARLDRADLFLLPSRQEGMPRAMIEAMARALPCIGSNVGGIPELLPPADLVPPGDVGALARKIREVVSDPARMARMSARNLLKAGEFREAALRERRTAFYENVKRSTQAYLEHQQGALAPRIARTGAGISSLRDHGSSSG